jgi:Ca2+-binding EF-hand superfamily protein
MYSNVGMSSLFNDALFERLFKLVDLDGDGALEKKEVVDMVLMALTGKTPPPQAVKEEK